MRMMQNVLLWQRQEVAFGSYSPKRMHQAAGAVGVNGTDDHEFPQQQAYCGLSITYNSWLRYCMPPRIILAAHQRTSRRLGVGMYLVFWEWCTITMQSTHHMTKVHSNITSCMPPAIAVKHGHENRKFKAILAVVITNPTLSHEWYPFLPYPSLPCKCQHTNASSTIMLF